MYFALFVLAFLLVCLLDWSCQALLFVVIMEVAVVGGGVSCASCVNSCVLRPFLWLCFRIVVAQSNGMIVVCCFFASIVA